MAIASMTETVWGVWMRAGQISLGLHSSWTMQVDLRLSRKERGCSQMKWTPGQTTSNISTCLSNQNPQKTSANYTTCLANHKYSLFSLGLLRWMKGVLGVQATFMHPQHPEAL